MNNSSAFWGGSETAWIRAVEKALPAEVTAPLNAAIKAGKITSGMFREGIGFKKDVFDNFDNSIDGINFQGARYAMETKMAAVECAEHAVKHVERLAGVVKGFRDNTKNDIASMKAASERVATEVQKMEARYRHAAELLTSPEFERAIANAERMATALDAISKLQRTEVHFSVLDQRDQPILRSLDAD